MRGSAVRTTTYESPAATPAGGKPGRTLSNHTDRSGTTIHGWRSIAFGSVFAVAGLGVGAAAWMEKLNAASGVPRWMGPVIGSIFAIAGLAFVMHGAMGLAMRRRVQRLSAYHAREPWVWDYRWDERGSRDNSVRGIARHAWMAGFLALFSAPFNWIGFSQGVWPFAIGAGLMDLVVVWMTWRVIYLAGQRAKYGAMRLRFRRFPFVVGEEVELGLAVSGAFTGASGLEGTLRCVEERYETHGTGDDRQSVVVCYELWSEVKCAVVERGEHVWRFAVPDGVPGTALSERPPKYWELEVKAEMPGIDYAGVFLVPVYEGRRR